MAGGTLGQRCKAFELVEAQRSATPRLPLLARLDGRAFHTWTRGLPRPVDVRLTTCMQDTTAFLVSEFGARVGYTQSDEITLLWFEPAGLPDALPFSGRFQKLASVLAGAASAKFTLLADVGIPERKGTLAVFDARVWNVPTLEDALDVFVWREDDATKNSVSMAASAFYPETELAGLDSRLRRELLRRKGVNWDDYPASFKRGSYLQRRRLPVVMDETTRARIPEAHRPASEAVYERSEVRVLNMPPIRQIGNALGVLLHGEDPRRRA